MGTNFKSLLARVESQYASLCKARLWEVYEKPSRKHIPNEPGVYVLYERGNALYPGRTGPKSGLRKRLGQHSLDGSDHKQAALARALACKKLGNGLRCPEGYDTHRFKEAFGEMKKRVRGMSVRWVEESDPDTRCLLEFYAAKELRTPYNDFSEH